MADECGRGNSNLVRYSQRTGLPVVSDRNIPTSFPSEPVINPAYSHDEVYVINGMYSCLFKNHLYVYFLALKFLIELAFSLKRSIFLSVLGLQTNIRINLFVFIIMLNIIIIIIDRPNINVLKSTSRLVSCNNLNKNTNNIVANTSFEIRNIEILQM